MSAAYEGATSLDIVQAVMTIEPLDGRDKDFHQFEYYMGETTFNAYKNLNKFEETKSIETKEAIMNAISGYIDEHSDKDSIWNVAGQKDDDEIEV